MRISSSAGRLYLGCMSTGMPRPLSVDGDRLAVLVQRDGDACRVAVDGLVDGVVDDLPDEVVQAVAVDAADVHAGPFADRLEAFEDGDVFGGVLAAPCWLHAATQRTEQDVAQTVVAAASSCQRPDSATAGKHNPAARADAPRVNADGALACAVDLARPCFFYQCIRLSRAGEGALWQDEGSVGSRGLRGADGGLTGCCRAARPRQYIRAVGARLHRGAHRHAGHRHSAAPAGQSHHDAQPDLPGLGRGPYAPEPLLPRSRAEAEPRPADQRRLRPVHAAQRPALPAAQSEVQPDLPRRVRGRLRLRPRRVPHRLPVLQRRADAAVLGQHVNVLPVRHTLRNVATWRARLFQAFVEADVGKLYFRFGRQNLAWGETDVFRLLDNINPLDNSFGGFLMPLDERRVPLDMLRMSYQLGNAAVPAVLRDVPRGLRRDGQRRRHRSRAFRTARRGSSRTSCPGSDDEDQQGSAAGPTSRTPAAASGSSSTRRCR